MDGKALRERLRGTEAEAVLLDVAEAGGRSSAGTVDAVTGGRRDSVRVVTELDALGLTEGKRNVYEVVLTGQGTRLAEQISTSRANGRHRSDAVRLGLGQWLYEHPTRPETADLFADDPSATVYGVPFTVNEIRHAVDYLREHALIVGKGTLQGPFLRPGLTPEGRVAVEFGEAIWDGCGGSVSGRPQCQMLLGLSP